MEFPVLWSGLYTSQKNIWLGCFAPGSFMTVWRLPGAPSHAFGRSRWAALALKSPMGSGHVICICIYFTPGSSNHSDSSKSYYSLSAINTHFERSRLVYRNNSGRSRSDRRIHHFYKWRLICYSFVFISIRPSGLNLVEISFWICPWQRG